jgi:hypothetical protein
MPLGSSAEQMRHDAGFGPDDAPVSELVVENLSADGSEETLFDDAEAWDYDLGEGD